MDVKENDDREQLFIDVDMDGGADVKMEHVVVSPTKDMVMLDINENVDNAIEFVVQIKMAIVNEVVGNTFPPSSPYESGHVHPKCVECYNTNTIDIHINR
jgi:hypothetical protein